MNLTRATDETFLEFAYRLAEVYRDKNLKEEKKDKGQFFTSIGIGKYMASLNNIESDEVSILDPGAGTGILSVALIESILKNNILKKIKLVVYETDLEILPYLQLVMDELKSYLEKKNINFDLIIKNDDFLLDNVSSFNNPDRLTNKFDIVISNPPYFKLTKKEFDFTNFQDVISGQPNIYFLFMAVAAKLLNETGEMIFITPRSFCSGHYYNKFRKWILETVNFKYIHLFESRKDLFSAEDVLQENIITKFVKSKFDNITVTKTQGSNFEKREKLLVLEKDVVYRSNGHIYFRIPSSEEELNVIRELDSLPNNFYKLGIKISTGKVVAFRNKEVLSQDEVKGSVPLLWMHNVKDLKINWPFSKKNKPISIIDNEQSKALLLPRGNYVLLKRFTTKEQKKRFSLGLIFEDTFPNYDKFALDNMLNYIYNPNVPFTKNQVYGIAQFLNLKCVDTYFRILNGHTQVNANEVYALPFPDLIQLEEIGKAVRDKFDLTIAEETKIIKRVDLDNNILVKQNG